MFTLVRVVIILGIFFFSTTMASPGITSFRNSDDVHSSMVVQIIQSQMVFADSMIESAKVVAPPSGTSGYADYAVDLKLKATAANKFSHLSEENIGKHANIILNGFLVSSPIIQGKLGEQFLLIGLTKKQAEQFIKNLR